MQTRYIGYGAVSAHGVVHNECEDVNLSIFLSFFLYVSVWDILSAHLHVFHDDIPNIFYRDCTQFDMVFCPRSPNLDHKKFL